MHDWEARAKLLEAENDTLREEVRALRRALMEAGEPLLFFGLTDAESAMFGVLMNNRAPRVYAFMAATRPTSRRMKRSSTFGFARSARSSSP